MGFFQKFTFKQDKLLAFYLGGRAKKCNIELHDVVFLVGKNSDDLVPQIKEQWFGTPQTLHVDSWFAIENVDGYDVELTTDGSDDKPESSELKLYFVNLGAYKKGGFGELHYMDFTVAKSVAEAKSKAKARITEDLVEVHTDDIYEVDDCIELEKVGLHRVRLIPGQKKNAEPVNGWQRVK